MEDEAELRRAKRKNESRAAAHSQLRVVSLLSASTEMVYRLGMAHTLVGRSHECDHPFTVQQLPHCSDPAIDPAAPSVRIDESVREHAAAGTPVYTIYAERLIALKPTLIITQSQCRVCAVTEPDLTAALDKWLASLPEGECGIVKEGGMTNAGGVQILSLEPMALRDIYQDVQRVANALKVPETGSELIAHMRQQELGVLRAVAAVMGGASPKMAVLEWNEPLMNCGHWHPDLVEIAGGVCVTGSHGGRVTVLPLADLAAAQPDKIVFTLCGFDLERSTRELRGSKIMASEEWQSLSAVQRGEVYVTDGNKHFNRSGPRILESAEILAELMWPALRGLWGHHGEAWLSLADALLWLERLDASSAAKQKH